MNIKIRKFAGIRLMRTLAVARHGYSALQIIGLFILIFACSGLDARAETAIETSCQSSIDSVLSRVKSVGGKVSEVERGNTDSKSNPFPTNQKVVIRLGARDASSSVAKKSADIMNSPVMQTDFAKMVFSSCPSVVELYFNLYATDWVTAYFRGRDGQVILGKCIGPGERPTDYSLLWGEYFCI
jgi:hypothetical protein